MTAGSSCPPRTTPRLDECAEAEIGPLWDFGMPNAGRTDIQYPDEHGAWKSI
ncbi:hypothetical protein ABZ897_51200 [Nonomuraea sp. NPDC046802]|uniref:hypothetical protein n=1 Tax=Nonomuraea sp. NPDC046802 TaxID=3154919 RepID=UPI0033F6B647